MIQQASVKAFQKVLQAAFDADEKLEWILVPVSYYQPHYVKPEKPATVFKLESVGVDAGEDMYTTLDMIENNHKVQPPLLVTRDGVGSLRAMLSSRWPPPARHEIALGVTWTCGYKNTTVHQQRAQIFDGHPGLDLATLSKKTTAMLPKYDILCTGNSYHFFIKGDPLESLNIGETGAEFDLIDDGWDNFRSMTGGYIRVSAFVKGEIINLEDVK